MANGLTGLAAGFAQGARLGMDIREQEARRAREKEDTLLRREASERADAQEVRAQAQEARSQEQHEASLLQMKQQEERAVKQEKRAESQEKRLQESQDLAKLRHDLDVKREKWDQEAKIRQEKETQIKAMAPVEFNRVLSGGSFSDEFMEMAKGTKYDPRFMNSPEYKDAAKLAYETTDKLISKFSQDPKSVTVSDYNKPDFINSLNVLLGPDVRYGVGQTDPNTGKTVDDKKIVSVLPAPNGKGFVFEVETTLSDGSKYTAPVTENRTTDPDDPVKVIPMEGLLDNIVGSMQMASAFNQADLKNYMTANFPVGGDVSASSQETTRRQWLREQGDVDKWEMDQLNDIDPLTTDDPEAAAAKIKKQAQERRTRIDERYGKTAPASVGAEGSKVPTPTGGGEARMDINTWAEGDSGKQQFLQQAQEQADMRGAENPFKAYSPSELDEIYREWRNDQEASGVADLMRQ